MSEVARFAGTHEADVARLYATQRAYFDSGATLSRAFRDEQLQRFDAAISKHAKALEAAMYEDLRKPEFEAYAMEVSVVLGDIRKARKNLSAWMRPTKHLPPLVLQPSAAELHPQPLGLSLVIAPWNYPVQLSLLPLVGAIAAGNCAILKPSELAPASSAAVAEVIREAFDPRYVACVEGAIPTSQALLAQPFDHFFFTGGPGVGRIVAKAAAEHLARCTLELGGKSPAIVRPSAHIGRAARRIVWGKFVNAGQTCIAPDYVLVDDAVYDEFVAAAKDAVRTSFGDDPKQSPDFARLVHERHLDRVAALIDPAKVALGGEVDRDDRYIAPTLLTEVTLDDAVMKEEIFGPVLPILRVSSVDEVKSIVRVHRNPLAAYIFTQDRAEADRLVRELSFGGGCINNTLLQAGAPGLPFGGLGTSGTGAYHGKHSFDVFSHYKGVIRAEGRGLFDFDLHYPPFEGKLDVVKWFID